MLLTFEGDKVESVATLSHVIGRAYKTNDKVFSFCERCFCKKHGSSWGDGVIGRHACNGVGGKGNNRKIKIYRSNYPTKMPNHSYDNGNDPKVKAVSVHQL